MRSHMAIFSWLLLMANTAELRAEPTDHTARIGKNVYKSACSGCHKWHGGGGGGYGGAALSLRETHLSHDQLEEVVRCGRPGTGMPSHGKDPYVDGNCYSMKAGTPGVELPGAANAILTPEEISSVATYVEKAVKGRGKSTLGECEAYWGPSSANCRDYKPPEGSPSPAENHE